MISIVRRLIAGELPPQRASSVIFRDSLSAKRPRRQVIAVERGWDRRYRARFPRLARFRRYLALQCLAEFYP